MAASYALAILVPLTAAELVLRSRAPRSDLYCVLPPGLRTTLRPGAGVLPGVSGDARFFTNSHGLRAEEATADREYHILALGGSTTECLFLDQSEAWPRLVQDGLNRRPGPRVWVGNAGRSGMTSRDHRLHARVLLRQEPETDTIVLLAGINDLTIRLLRDDAYDPHYLEDPGTQDRQTRHAFAVSPAPAAEPDRTPQLWKLLTQRASRSHPSAHGPEQYPVWRRRRREATHLRDKLPDLTSALEEYARNLQAVVETSRAHGVRLLLLTQPTLWREDLSREEQDLLWFGGIGDFMRRDVDTYYSAGALARGMRLYNDTLLEVCRSSGLECLDLAAQMGGDRALFYDDCHLTERGASRLAELVADALASRDPWPEAR